MQRDPLYFAYGSNLNAGDLTRWCLQRGFPYPLGKKVANAYLPDSRLIFNYDSPSRGGGMLNIRYHAGQVAPGVLFKVLPGGWAALDAKGTAENMYKHLDSIILTEDGHEHLAVAYQVDGANTSGDFVKPHPDYLNVVRDGLRAHGIDDGFLQPLSEGKIPPFPVGRLFVYGSLMSQGSRNYLLADSVDLSSRVEAEAPGLLYDSGKDFPCMIPDETGRHKVTGELYVLTDFKKAFEKLDFIEMTDRHRTSNIYFRRAIVRAAAPDGTTCLAWSYLAESDVEGMPQIPSGSWRHVGP